MVLAGISAGLTAFAIRAFLTASLSLPDFAVFYWNAISWRQHASMYASQIPNLASPLTMLAIFVPLSHVPYRLAQITWMCLGAVCLSASVNLVRDELDLPLREVAQIVVVLGLSFASFYAWMEGQTTWILLYPVTRAWVAARRMQWIAAGAWFTPAIVAKPILALTALLLPTPLWISAAIGSVTLTAVAMLVTGWRQWAAWLKLGIDVWQLGYPANASLWGLASRLQTGNEYGVGIPALHPIWWVLIGGTCLLAAGVTVREREIDVRMFRALLVTLAVAPLGWIYYLPWLMPPAVAAWKSSRRTLVAFAFFCVPIPFLVPIWQRSPFFIRSIGSAYSVGLLVELASTATRSARIRSTASR